MDPSAVKDVYGLAAVIEALPTLDPVKRARVAKALMARAKTVLSQARQGAIAEALNEGRTYAQLAGELTVSPAAINAAVTAHNASMRAVTGERREVTQRGSLGVGPIIDGLLESGVVPPPGILNDADDDPAPWATPSPAFLMSIYEDDGDVERLVAPDLPVTFLAYPGLRIMWHGRPWRVERVTVDPPFPGSAAEQEETGLTFVDVVACASPGSGPAHRRRR